MIEKRKPVISISILTVIILGCVFANVISPYNPYRMELLGINLAPSMEHLFGTDTLGRDLFSVIWFGGRISLVIGLLSGFISTTIAMIYGTLAGLTSDRVDDIMMRFTEIIMSIPQILLVMFLQAMFGKATVISIALVIGITGWMAIAKMVRSEVKQLRSADFVIASRTMGGGFFYILRVHLLPNLFSSVMFMIVTNIGSAIVMEATLSFLGLGLPTNVISWGSLMSLSQRAMLTGCWWMIIIPGIFLITTLICITEIGEWIRVDGRKDRLL